MNREIKFRCWDKKDKQMIVLESQYVSEALHYYENGTHEFMQYTGLFDKHGKEIYEGDILKDLEGTLGIVKFNNGRFEAFDGSWDNLEFPDESEIIGNIYENPNLIK